MSWIKRNLFFLIGAVVALALLGMAGFYLYSKWNLNNTVLAQLTQSHEDLKKLNSANPHPGSGNVDNIGAAREQIKEVRAAMAKTRQYFQKIPPVPDLPKVNDFDFSSSLARTIAQLARDATNSSVGIPAGYSFSFQAQRNKMGFAAGSLPPLAKQLGEVKAICEVLFAAKVNSLDYVRRERVSPDDAAGSQSDYLAEKSVTNALAILSPYEVSFHCFSPELGGVLSGLANSPHGLIAQYVNVEIAAAPTVDPNAPALPPVTLIQQYQPQPQIPSAVSADQAFRQRYGIGGGRPGEGGAADAFRSRYGGGPGKLPSPAPPPYQPPVAIAAPAAAAKTGLPTVIDEKQLRVTILITVVKLTDPAPGK